MTSPGGRSTRRLLQPNGYPRRLVGEINQALKELDQPEEKSRHPKQIAPRQNLAEVLERARNNHGGWSFTHGPDPKGDPRFRRLIVTSPDGRIIRKGILVKGAQQTLAADINRTVASLKAGAADG
ncbi:hypothetical protein [Paludisphaera rhizosphaerae]|uniref:hypothetical protein n=1 Tax=Paludisphaera rhizosphaerae TaxID=2711216 RepID=UPI0013EAE31E|nr:hypothetical protein [Paludisphaera rhizosphaerae]